MMHFLLVDNGSKHLEELRILCGPDRSRVIPVDGITKVHPGPEVVYVLSGSHDRPVVGYEDYYRPELDLIAAARNPIVGVCLGFELIAYQAGARLERAATPENGLVKVFPTAEGENWFPPHDIQVAEAHRWVVQDVPPGYIGLAASGDGIEAIANPTRRIIGFQFHPEHVSAGSDGAAVFQRVLERIEAG